MNPVNPAQIAADLSDQLVENQIEYAIGGALALGFWGAPRGTLDVDITLFMKPEKPAVCVNLLLKVGCQMAPTEALETLTEHGFCRVSWQQTRIDVFLPIAEFYQRAKARRRTVPLGTRQVQIWDAESLTVFKLMFFRRKDLADIEQILRQQGPLLDREWIRKELVSIYGTRDPRIAAWDELAAEIVTEE